MTNASTNDLDKSVAILENEIKHILDRLDRQDEVLKKQSEAISELLALANKGSGAIWMLTGAAAVVGAVVSNIKYIFSWFIH